MRETYEFRIPEARAAAALPPEAGEVLNGRVRRVAAAPDSPLFEAVGRAAEAARARGEVFFSSWSVRRRFAPGEAESAALFLLLPEAATEQAGEPGESGEIALDLRKLPKKDVVVTLAGERVVSQRVAELVLEAGLSGVELRRVRHRERKDEDPVDLSAVPSGRRLLEMAAAAGHPHPGWGFWVWINRPEQRPLAEAAAEEQWALAGPARRRREAAAPPWYRLVVVSRPVPTVLPTRFGIDPFDDDERGEYRDAAGGVAGLNLLSELYVDGEGWDGSDFAETREKVGAAGGLVRPKTLLLATPRVRALFAGQGVKGVSFEAAHLVRGGEPALPEASRKTSTR